ncbi:FAD-binding protein [Mesorhizobium atlanticum]
MEFDVVIVGAGPAGLAAAIRLKQLNPELSVVVLEKGGEVGAHILSGAVVDLIGIDRLLPGWREEGDHPFQDACHGGPFPGPWPCRLVPPAERPDAAADEQPRQLHRLARQCLPLAGDKGRGVGRRDLSGLRRGKPGLQRCRRRHRRHHRRHGRREGRHARPGLRARHGADEQICADRRRRARLLGQAAHRQIPACRRPRAGQVRHWSQGTVAGQAGEP